MNPALMQSINAALHSHHHFQSTAHLVAIQAANQNQRNAALFATANQPGGIPNLVLQAVVEFGDKNADGRTILALAPAWFEILSLLEKDPSLAFQIPHWKWEEIIAGSYERRGFKVTLTPRSGDLGRDVVAEKSGWGCVRFIDQVKAYKPGRVVTADEVRSLLGVLQADHGTNKGVVTTTSGFAPKIEEDRFIKPFLPTRLELVNGAELHARLMELAKAPATW